MPTATNPVIAQLADSVETAWTRLRQTHVANSDNRCESCDVVWPCQVAVDAADENNRMR